MMFRRSSTSDELTTDRVVNEKKRRVYRFPSSLLFVLLLLWAVSGLAADNSTQVHFNLLHSVAKGEEYTPGEHWQRAVRPEVMEWSSAELDKIKDYANEIGTTAIVIVQRGVVVDAWGALDSRISVQSIRKPLLGALIGIEVDAGRLNLNATLADFGIYDVDPTLNSTELKATLRELLLSRSGVYHVAAYETDTMRKTRPSRGSYLPGEKFYYNNWDFNVLGTIYESTTGSGIFTAFDARLAKPLEMEYYRKKDGRYVRSRSSVHSAYPFKLSALDLARFGLLYLREGVWKGRSIVPANWVRESVTLKPEANGVIPRKGFAYLWWIRPESYSAVGSGGQRLTVFPDKRLVIAHLAERREGHKRTSGSQVRKLAYMIYDIAPSQADN